MLRVIESELWERWIRRLRDVRGEVAIARQVSRIAKAGKYVGDWKPVGEGVVEVRIMGKGPGYRLYLSIRDGKVLLLLVGGDKSTQGRDIDKAKQVLKEWERGERR